MIPFALELLARLAMYALSLNPTIVRAVVKVGRFLWQLFVAI